MTEARIWDGNETEFREWLGYKFGRINSDGSLVIFNRSGRVVVPLADWVVEEGDDFYPYSAVLFRMKWENAS